MLKRIFGWLNEAEPSAKAMATLLGESDTILAELDNKIEPHSIQGEALKDIKKTYEKAKGNLPLSNQGVDKEKWDGLKKTERGNYFADISSIKHALIGLDYPDLRAGTRTFAALAVALLLSSTLYVALHIYYSPESSIQSAGLTTLQKEPIPNAQDKPAKKVSTQRIYKVAGIGNPGADVTPNLKQPINNALMAENIVELQKLIAILRLQFNKPPADNADWQALADTDQQLSSLLPKERLSYSTLKVLGNLSGAIKQQNLQAGKDSIRSLENAIAQDLEDPPALYLWTKGRGKWLEVAFWSLFGVLVGLLYFVSKRLKEGLFDRQDIATMAAEAIMAPIVACVIFFLLEKTEITEISAAGESIFIVLGFAFILGYAIRRTVGLLDNIKTRLLPEP